MNITFNYPKPTGDILQLRGTYIYRCLPPGMRGQMNFKIRYIRSFSDLGMYLEDIDSDCY